MLFIMEKGYPFPWLCPQCLSWTAFLIWIYGFISFLTAAKNSIQRMYHNLYNHSNWLLME